MRPRLGIAAAFLMALLLAACATTTKPLPDMAPGTRPAIDTDEAGLWMYMDKIEQNLRTSGRIETDAGLNRYVRGIICKLAFEHCPDMRVYIVQTPHFNATMAPNGCMQVWTGLMLRAQNEAQLAYVLGHEIGHYQKRHTIQQWRVIRDTSSALIFFQLATAAAGAGFSGDIAHLVALAGILAYSRDMERESDAIGIELMARAGYDPREASKIWRLLEAEREAADDPEQFIFFRTHPTSEERMQTLDARAAQMVQPTAEGRRRQNDYIAMIRPFRGAWLRDELRKRDYAASGVVLEHLAEVGDQPGEILFFQGEIHRMRAREGDLEKALAYYAKAATHEPVPVAVYRAMGLLHWKLGQRSQARTYLQDYLDRSPQASDREMIRAYLRELEQ